jgi:hypothetical protein
MMNSPRKRNRGNFFIAITSERLNVFFLILGTRQGCFLVKIVLKVLAHTTKQEKKINDIKIGKEF